MTDHDQKLHSKRIPAGDDGPERAELWERGALVRVEYLGEPPLDSVRGYHARTYPSHQGVIESTICVDSGYEWRGRVGFESAGVVACAKLLQLGEGHELMEIEADARGQTTAISKYVWRGDELVYVFEYGPEGRPHSGLDLRSAEDVRVDEVVDTLEDPDFYREGWRLPSSMSATSVIPSTPASQCPRPTTTSEPEVIAHELDFPDREGELEFIGELIETNVEHILTVETNLGAAFDDSRCSLGFRWSLGQPPEQILEGLRGVAEFGVALFHRGSFGPDVSLSLTLGGARVEVPGGISYYNSAPRWADAVGAAMALRDADALARLSEFDVDSFLGSYDSYHDVYARAVIAFVTGSGDAERQLEQAVDLAGAAKSFPERGRRLGMPLAELAKAVVCGDEAAFNEHLAEGLECYRTLHSRSPDRSDASAVVPLRLLGWSALAHDRGLSCRVRSGYLPPWLVEGIFRAQ